jgi:hypothetical protein
LFCHSLLLSAMKQIYVVLRFCWQETNLFCTLLLLAIIFFCRALTLSARKQNGVMLSFCQHSINYYVLLFNRNC